MTDTPGTAPAHEHDRQKAFHLVVRQALLMIVAWIEKEHGLDPRCPACKRRAPPP